MTVITRFAPSPTGLLHVGNMRTALINFLFAHAHNGRFILRMDDTDQERSKQEYITAIKEDMLWLGLNWDEMFTQSSRMDRYEDAKRRLIECGRLYPCYETKEELVLKKKNLLSRNLPPIYDRSSLRLTAQQKVNMENNGIRPHWRFLLNQGEISLKDRIRGYISFNSANLSDPVLVRADGTMTYTIASIVDDIDFNVTDIIRGEDHITSSAIHIQIFHALGQKEPNFAHISLLSAKEQEISKRLGGFDIRAMREKGLEPMAVASFLAALGTSNALEYSFTLEELINAFSLDRYSKAPSTYDQEELLRFNERFLHQMPYELAQPQLKAAGMGMIDELFWDSVKGNISIMKDIKTWWDICHTVIVPKMIDQEITKAASQALPPEPWGVDVWDKWMMNLKPSVTRSGKHLFLPLRLALTGLEYGPELKVLLPLLGYKKTFARLNGAPA